MWWDTTLIANAKCLLSYADEFQRNNAKYSAVTLPCQTSHFPDKTETHLIFFRFIRHCTTVTALAPPSDTPQSKPWQLSGHQLGGSIPPRSVIGCCLSADFHRSRWQGALRRSSQRWQLSAILIIANYDFLLQTSMVKSDPNTGLDLNLMWRLISML